MQPFGTPRPPHHVRCLNEGRQNVWTTCSRSNQYKTAFRAHVPIVSFLDESVWMQHFRWTDYDGVLL